MTRFVTPGVLHRALIGLLAGLALATSAATTADAATIRQQADSIMNKDYKSFIAYKKSALSVAGPYLFDWTDNGCSFVGPGKAEFDAPCQQHDFGYRNYGEGWRHLSVDEDTRYWIDGRLRTEMRRRCVDLYVVLSYRNDCYSWAQLYYLAVRNHGVAAFYGD